MEECFPRARTRGYQSCYPMRELFRLGMPMPIAMPMPNQFVIDHGRQPVVLNFAIWLGENLPFVGL